LTTTERSSESGGVTTEDPERQWLANVHRPGEKQLTVRAVIAGMVIGAVMCLSNLYVVLKTGWSMGVTLTACILAWAVFRVVQAARLSRSDFTILENNAMCSVASAAGYMTGGGNMAAVPALLMLTGALPSTGPLILWLSVIAALGVFAAIPIKRQLINREQLAFPTGTATAETLRALHSHEGSGASKAKLLFGAAVIGAIVAWMRDAKASWMPFNLPAHFGFPFSLKGHAAVDWTLGVEGSLLLFGGGSLMSFRTGWSMALGATIAYGILAPMMVESGVIQVVAYKTIVQWTLWTGAALMVSSGLLAFAFQWRMIAASFSQLARLFGKSEKTGAEDPLRDIECPPHWFPLGFATLGPVVIVLMIIMFGVPWWAAIIALPLALVMGVVAARVTGETDVTPTKALGPVTQLIYGGLVPANIPVNVMSANVTGGIGLHAADLLTDLKSGFLLGANPRQQFYAQLFGVVAGAAIVVPAFNLLVPSADILGTEKFPAPGALVWAGVSKLLSVGISALHPTARTAVAIGAVVGVVLALFEQFGPKHLRKYVPSASGLGVGFMIPAYNAFMFALGALSAELVRRRKGKEGDEITFPIGAGFIAGESLMGVAIALLTATAVIGK
jgi:OPT family oligopeptide transporter